MKAPFEWELIENTPNNDQASYRAKVEGGWLVNHVVYPHGVEALMHMTTTFVPDPQHNWIIDKDAKQGIAVGEPCGTPPLDKWNTPIV